MKLSTIMIIFSFFILSGTTCNRVIKLAELQDLVISPSPIYVEDNKLAFNIQLTIPEQLMKRPDSIVYYFIANSGIPDSLYRFSFNQNSTSDIDGVLQHNKDVMMPFALEVDSTTLRVQMERYKNGKVLSSYSLPLALIKKDR